MVKSNPTKVVVYCLMVSCFLEVLSSNKNDVCLLRHPSVNSRKDIENRKRGQQFTDGIQIRSEVCLS